jgi:hypothetical protein
MSSRAFDAIIGAGGLILGAYFIRIAVRLACGIGRPAFRVFDKYDKWSFVVFAWWCAAWTAEDCGPSCVFALVVAAGITVLTCRDSRRGVRDVYRKRS